MDGRHMSRLPNLSTLVTSSPRSSCRRGPATRDQAPTGVITVPPKWIPTGMQQGDDAEAPEPPEPPAPPDPPLQRNNYGPGSKWAIDALDPELLAHLLGNSLRFEDPPTNPRAGLIQTPEHMQPREGPVYYETLCKRVLQLQSIARGTRTRTVMLQLYKDLSLLMRVDKVELRRWEKDKDDYFARIKIDVEDRCKFLQKLNAKEAAIAGAPPEWVINQKAGKVLSEGPVEPYDARLARALWYCKHAINKEKSLRNAIQTLFRCQEAVPESQKAYINPLPVVRFPTHGVYTLGNPPTTATALGHFLALQPSQPTNRGNWRLDAIDIVDLIATAVTHNLPEAVDELRAHTPNTQNAGKVGHFLKTAVTFANPALMLAILHRDNLTRQIVHGELHPLYVQADFLKRSFYAVDSAEKAALLYLPFAAAVRTNAKAPFAPAYPNLFEPNPDSSHLVANRIAAYVTTETNRLDDFRYDYVKRIINVTVPSPWNVDERDMGSLQKHLDRFKALVNVEGRRPPTNDEATEILEDALDRMTQEGTSFTKMDTLSTQPLLRAWFNVLKDLCSHVTLPHKRKHLLNKFPTFPFPWN